MSQGIIGMAISRAYTRFPEETLSMFFRFLGFSYILMLLIAARCVIPLIQELGFDLGNVLIVMGWVLDMICSFVMIIYGNKIYEVLDVSSKPQATQVVK